MTQQKYYLDWQEVDSNWEDIGVYWEDFYILIEVADIIKGGGNYSEYVKGNPWKKISQKIGEEKTKKFIKIFCRINELDYEKVIEKNSKIKVTVSHFEKVFQNIPNTKIPNVKIKF